MDLVWTWRWINYGPLHGRYKCALPHSASVSLSQIQPVSSVIAGVTFGSQTMRFSSCFCIILFYLIYSNFKVHFSGSNQGNKNK
jgi:hypothetical protein